MSSRIFTQAFKLKVINYETPLHVAIRHRDFIRVKKILNTEEGVRMLHVRDHKGSTPLTICRIINFEPITREITNKLNSTF